MSLNLSEVPANDAKKFDKPLPKAGVQPARVSHVIDLGIQTRLPFKGKEKSPVHQVMITHELVTDEYSFEDKKFKHRLSMKPFNVVSKNSEMYSNSAIADYLSGIDPKDSVKGDLVKLVNTPCLATVVHVDGLGKHLGKKFANIVRVSAPPDGYTVPELSSPPVVFDFYKPDEAVWEQIPSFIQDRIKSAVDYPGSKVEALVKRLEAAAQTNETK